MTSRKRVQRVAVFASLMLGVVTALAASADQDDPAPPVGAEEQATAAGEEDPTGTDPRAFGTKFMPYYRYVHLDNELDAHMLTFFGLVRFSDNVAVTYEIPIVKEVDYSDVDAFEDLGEGLPPSLGSGQVAQTAIPFDDLESDGDVVGVGDTNFRMFFKGFPGFEVPWREGGKLEFMTGFETTVPTATQDVLGGETWVLSPMATVIMDMPFFAFIAGMNFYDFDVVKDKSRGDVSRYRGRWFYMQPLTPPDLGPWLGGFYLLPELQPVYDFEVEEFSFWIGPEFGKIVAPGRIVYVKPGWGIDPDPAERKFTFEAGFRWFF